MLIPIKDWDKQTFRKTHCTTTLHAWARTQQTEPPAIKVGKQWLIDETAVYVGLQTVDSDNDMSDRVKSIFESCNVA